jgi:hypothetical protein
VSRSIEVCGECRGTNGGHYQTCSHYGGSRYGETPPARPAPARPALSKIETGKPLTPEQCAISFALLDAIRVATARDCVGVDIWAAANAFIETLSKTHDVVPKP